MKPRRLHSDTILSIVTTSFGIGRAVWQLISAARCRSTSTAARTGTCSRRCRRSPTRRSRRARSAARPVQRVFHPIAVHFKGSGFYNTDYGTSKRKREMDASAKSGADKHDAKSKDKQDSGASSSGSKDSGSSPPAGSAD